MHKRKLVHVKQSHPSLPRRADWYGENGRSRQGLTASNEIVVRDAGLIVPVSASSTSAGNGAAGGAIAKRTDDCSLSVSLQDSVLGMASVDVDLVPPNVSIEWGWISMGTWEPTRMSVATAGYASLAETPGTFSTEPVQLPEGEISREYVLCILRFTWEDTYIGGYGSSPDISHPGANFGSSFTDIGLGTEYGVNGSMSVYTSDYRAGSSEIAPIVMEFPDLSTNAIAWIVVAVDFPDANSYIDDYNYGFGYSESIVNAGQIGYMSNSSMLFVGTHPGTRPVFSAPWNEHVTTVYGQLPPQPYYPPT